MCEPAHSIVQYPDRNDDDHNLPGGDMDMDQRLTSTLGRWGKRLLNWWHFSKVGSGHTQAINLSGKASLILPEHTRYEGLWWERKFILDGPFHGPSVDKKAALTVAEQYHNQTVMGSMKQFRQFFEQSLRNTTRGQIYVYRFVENVLSQKGKDQFYARFKQVFGKGVNMRDKCLYENPEKLIKTIMRFTRQRGLFRSHWSDDDKLWI